MKVHVLSRQFGSDYLPAPTGTKDGDFCIQRVFTGYDEYSCVIWGVSGDGNMYPVEEGEPKQILKSLQNSAGPELKKLAARCRKIWEEMDVLG